MSNRVYSGAEIKKMLSESSLGYKPVIGAGVSSENKKINNDSNKESIKKTELKFNEGEEPTIGRTDQSSDLGNNKNMLDLEFSTEPSKEWRDRVKQQVTGEDSKMGNSPTDASPNDGNKEFYKNAKDASKKATDTQHLAKTSGITTNHMNIPKRKSVFGEGKNYKRLNFKNTIFLDEKHMLSYIPEEFKKDGNKFIMEDKNSNEYFIEWVARDMKYEGRVVDYRNDKKLTEEFNRVKHLYSYNPQSFIAKPTKQEILDESNSIENNLNKIRNKIDIE